MKLLLLDLARRWWLLMLLPLVVAFCSTASAPTPAGASALIPFLGALRLSLDLASGTPRVLCLRPVAATDIGRAWWIFSVPVSWGACMTGASLGWLVRLSLPAAKTTLAMAAVGWLTQAAFAACWAGVSFIALAFLPTMRESGVGAQIRQGVAGLLWGLNVGASVFVIHGLGNMLQGAPALHPGAVALLAAVVPVWLTSWLLGPMFVARRTSAPTRPMPAPLSASSGASLRIGESLGGLRQWLLREALLQTIMVWAFALVTTLSVTAVFRMQGAGSQGPDAPAFLGFIIMVPMIRSLMPSLRHFRTLPVSVTKLAACLVLFPTALLSVNCLLMQLAFARMPHPFALAVVNTSVVVAAAALGVVVALRMKFMVAIALIGGLAGPLMGLNAVLQRTGVPDAVAASVVAGAVCWVVCAFFIARHWLRTSPLPYRTQRLIPNLFAPAASR